MLEVRDPAPPAKPASQPVPEDLIAEIKTFGTLCHQRYRFNSIWDNVLNVLGICVSLGIVACGVYKQSEYAAILGGVVAAIVTAQRAFPFNQRWQFYRVLESETLNLLTEARNGILGLDQTVAALKAMRLDFAQQIPRGSSFRSTGDSSNGKSSAE